MRSLFLALALALAPLAAHAAPEQTEIDAQVRAAMARTGAKGLAVAVIEDGQVAFTRAYGVRNAKGEPLTEETVMYGASLTKTAFAYMVMQLVEEGRLDLDASIAGYLPKPLPDYTDPAIADAYAAYGGLAGDERWRSITPRVLLTHSAGFANFGFLEPDEKLHIHFQPGSRYAYSGDGLILLQFVLEQGLGIDVGREMQRRVFDRLGMRLTAMTWRPYFAEDLADGWDETGKPHPHDERGRVRAAGSMDTTIADMGRFAAGLVRGQGLTPRSRVEMRRRQLAITTASQFPTLQPELPPEQRRADLAAGLGLVLFDGPQGRGFFKGGHDDITGNTLVCLETGRRCVVLLSNDVRAEAAYPGLVRFLLGETGVPYGWEYGPKAANW